MVKSDENNYVFSAISVFLSLVLIIVEIFDFSCLRCSSSNIVDRSMGFYSSMEITNVI